MHAAACKGVVAADEELAVVVLLSADAHMAVNGLCDVSHVLERSDSGRDGRHIDSHFHSRHAAEDCVLLNGGEVGSAACRLRCGAVVADGVTEATDAHHAVGEFYRLCRPVVGHRESHGLRRCIGSHRVLVAPAFRHAYAFGRLLVIKESLEVVYACQLACRMIEARVLHGHGVARLYNLHHLVADLDVAMAGLGGQDLIDALALRVGEADDIAALGEEERVAAVAVIGDAFRGEACVGGHRLADDGAGQRDRADAFGCEGVAEAVLRVEVIEHVELGIDILHRELGVDGVAATPRRHGAEVFLVDGHVGDDARGLLSDSYDERSGVLGPDGAPVVATCEAARGGAIVVVIQVDAVVGDKHDGRALAHCRQQFILDLHDALIRLAVEVDDGEVEVRLDEVVGSSAVGELPVAHRQDVVRVAHAAELQEAGGVDVEEEVAHVVAAVGGHVVIDGLGASRLHVGIGEGERGTLCLVAAHGEDAGLRQLAFLRDAVVVLLFVSKDVVIDRAAVGDAFRRFFLELHEVSRLGANEAGGSRRHRDAVRVAHRGLGLYGSVEVDGACVAYRQVTFCLTGFGGNQVEVVGVAVEDEEHLVAAGVLTNRGVHRLAFLRGNQEVQTVVGAIDPICVLHTHLGGIDGEGGVVGIDVELDGAAHRFAVGSRCCQEIRAGSGLEGVLVAGGLAHTHAFAGRNVDQRLNQLAFRIHCHRHFGGKDITRGQHCQPENAQ